MAAQLKNQRRILIIGNPCSPLTQERGLVGRKGGYGIYWYSAPKAELKDLNDAFSPPLNRFRFAPLYSPLFLTKVIKNLQPDLIHTFYAYQQLDTLVIARFRPLVLTLMGAEVLPEQRFNGRRRWPIKMMLDSADIITSKSSFMDEALDKIGNYAYKIRRITWGVDAQRFRPGLDVSSLRQKWDIQQDDLVFFSPRICQPFYNQHLIIQSFAHFLNQAGSSRKAKLIVSELFPEEAYCQKLRKLVTGLNLKEHVRFVGAIEYQEMPSYFNLADIMVAIPPSDGMPHSLYEAMACGTYPVLGKLPQYHELIQDGVNGRLVTVGDINGLMEAMCSVSENLEQRKSAAIINRQRILEIADKDVQERLMISIYDELIRKYKKSPKE
jgi:glycosyltransferase involved in cell wall biosynthesis